MEFIVKNSVFFERQYINDWKKWGIFQKIPLLKNPT